MDTLDNVAGLRKYAGHIDDLFGSVSEENVARIKRQNHRRISVIIGNPPYNANQLNENENNKNREYPNIDKRIKETYIAASTAQKTKLYDMYARFFRWASDRLDENGVLALITNRSFIDSRTFDGFRKMVAQEFNEIHVVDLGGDVRANPKLSGTKHNVFGIQTGVAISFLVRHAKKRGCRIFYTRRPEMETAEEKLAWLSKARLGEVKHAEISPDEKHNWLNLTDNDFDTLIPIASKETKRAKKPGQERAIFKLYSLGVKTNRDDWVTDFSKISLAEKVEHLIQGYESERARLVGTIRAENVAAKINYEIKWTRKLKRLLVNGVPLSYDSTQVTNSQYRPFTSKWTYFSNDLNEDWYQLPQIMDSAADPMIMLSGYPSQKPFQALASSGLWHHDTLDKTNGAPLYRLVAGKREDNITDWALKQFRNHYKAELSPGTKGNKTKARPITREAIFHYVYGVLHDPVYREKYALNLKREFPRIPFYADFWQWAEWGKELMGLHIGYEAVEPYPLERTDVAMDGGTPVREGRSKSLLAEAAGSTGNAKADAPKALLKADKDGGRILLDAQTTLGGVPPEAWDYQLGNRSALEWILDQYKEKKPKDPTIREKFNTYRFADYKEKVVDLLQRVTTVSVRTMEIVNAMKKASSR